MRMKDRARHLRKAQTIAEEKLWFTLRKRKFYCYKFRRQHVLGSYIVDFVCLQKKLVVELDGSQHLDNQKYDENRTLFLNGLGFRILRFWNHEVLTELNSVLSLIQNALV